MPHQDTTNDTGDARPGAGTPAGIASALGTCLAPLKTEHVFDGAIGYVLHGTGPEILATLDDLRSTPGAKVVSAGRRWHQNDIPAVAEVEPGWSRDAGAAARLVVHRDAPADVLVRFGHLLNAIARTRWHGPHAWLSRLAEDVLTAGTSTGGQAVHRRWTPDFLSYVARAGGVPDRTLTHTVLRALLQRPDGHTGPCELLASDAGDAFLARHADVLAEIVGEAPFGREFAARRCSRSPERHADLLAALAVDELPPVRKSALAGLDWLDGSRQVDALRPHLRTAAPDRLAVVLGRLTDVEGGPAAIEDALSDPEVQLDDVRATLLRRAADRASLARGPGAVVSVPPTALPDDTGLMEELAAQTAAARRTGDRFWGNAARWLPRIPDVRVLRDMLRQAGMINADRLVAGLLITATTPTFGPKTVAVLTREDAERWWPLFAERLDLVVEYLDGTCTETDTGDARVDTADMILTILECFPAVPEALLPRLTSLALSTSRHRLAARRVLGDPPGVRAAARAALDDDEAMTRASAAEWLAGLGEPGIVPPEPGWEFGDGVLSPATRALPAATLRWLDRFREQALERGVPAPDVNRWLALARPVLRTAPDGSGTVVGGLGGPLMLPPDVPTPRGGLYEDEDEDEDTEHQLIVTLDLSAIPAGATDVPLPPDGTLLLFANPDLEPWPAGGAVYVPAGVPVEEREASPDYDAYYYDTPQELDAELRRVGELRLAPGVSLPGSWPDDETLARHPHARTLREVWSHQTDGGGEWQLGGHAIDFEGWGDPVAGSAFPEGGERFSDPGDWVLLAQWNGFFLGSLYWTITRQDLEARRFDRVAVQMYANP